MDTLRERIVVYFEKKDKIRLLMKDTSYKLIFMEEIPEGIEKELMQRQITILNDKTKYLEDKRKIEEAIDFFMKNTLIYDVKEFAGLYGIPVQTFLAEICHRRIQGERYRYNRKVNKNNTGLTYHDEELLLMAIELELLDKPCSCRICCLLKLSTVAYEFVKNYNYSYPSDWDLNGRVDFKFIEEFEMRNSNEIFHIFDFNCSL